MLTRWPSDFWILAQDFEEINFCCSNLSLVWGAKDPSSLEGCIQDSLTVYAWSVGCADTIFLCAPQLYHTAPKAPCPPTAPVLRSPWHHDFWALETLLSDITITQTEVKTAEVWTKIATSEKRWAAYMYTYHTHTHTIHIHTPYHTHTIYTCVLSLALSRLNRPWVFFTMGFYNLGGVICLLLHLQFPTGT